MKEYRDNCFKLEIIIKLICLCLSEFILKEYRGNCFKLKIVIKPFISKLNSGHSNFRARSGLCYQYFWKKSFQYSSYVGTYNTFPHFMIFLAVLLWPCLQLYMRSYQAGLSYFSLSSHFTAAIYTVREVWHSTEHELSVHVFIICFSVCWYQYKIDTK